MSTSLSSKMRKENHLQKNQERTYQICLKKDLSKLEEKRLAMTIYLWAFQIRN